MGNDLTFLTKLKYYSLDSKLIIAQKISSSLMGGASIGLDNILKTNITPTEIEVFTTYSIVYDSGSDVAINSDAFIEVMNQIRNYLKTNEDSSFGKRLFSSIMVQQVSSQISFVQRLFRYNKFFGYSDESFSMKNEFEKKFGRYIEYEIFAASIYIFLSNDLRKVFGNYYSSLGIQKAFGLKNVVSNLSISSDSFRKELLKFYKSDTDKLYNGLKINCLFPIIETPECRYIPNPYLVIDAVTSSLLNRLTENKGDLRRWFGKRVIETYLYNVCNELSFKTYLSKEFEYDKSKKKTGLTSDVLLGLGDYFIFFDTKAKTPKVGIRNLEAESYADDLDIYIEDYTQLINQYYDLKKGLIKLDKEYNIKNVFFIDVVLEDSYIDRKDIADEAIKKYKDNLITSEDENVIRGNILILSLNEIEKYFLRDTNILNDLLLHRDDKNRWYDIQLSSDVIENKFIRLFDDYFKELFDSVKEYYS